MKTFFKLLFLTILINIYLIGCGYNPNEEQFEGVMDLTAPTLSEVTAITSTTEPFIKDPTPDYTYSSSENGTNTFGGSCSSNSTLTEVGNNTITLGKPVTVDNLSDATYSDCTITVTDWALNESSALTISEFTVDILDPTATVTADTVTTSENALIRSSETGVGYLVNSSITVDNLTNITSASDNQWNRETISSANTNTSISALGLSAGIYKGYTLDNATNLSTASTNSVTVLVDYALDFDGTNDNVSANGAVAGIDNSDNLPLSVSVWVYPEDDTSSQIVFGFFKNSPFSGNGPSVWYGTTDGKFEYHDAVSSNSVASSSSSKDNWHHLVLTIGNDRGGILYVNGSSVASFSAAFNSGGLDMFSLGMDYDNATNSAGNPSNYFNGKMDELALWNDELSSAEVTAIYNSGKMFSVASNSGNYASASNLLAYFRLNEGSGTTLQDNSSNSNVGSINGTSWTAGFISK